MFNKKDKSNYNELLTIFQEHKNKLFLCAYKIVKDKYVAEDLLQDSFEAVARHIDNFATLEEPHKVSYLYRTVQNKAVNHYHRGKNEINNLSIEDEKREFADPVEIPLEDIVISNESIAVILEELKKLDEKYRGVLFLSTYYNFHDKEIAEILGISENLVRVRRLRGRARLKKALHRGGENSGR